MKVVASYDKVVFDTLEELYKFVEGGGLAYFHRKNGSEERIIIDDADGLVTYGIHFPIMEEDLFCISGTIKTY